MCHEKTPVNTSLLNTRKAMMTMSLRGMLTRPRLSTTRSSGWSGRIKRHWLLGLCRLQRGVMPRFRRLLLLEQDDSIFSRLGSDTTALISSTTSNHQDHQEHAAYRPREAPPTSTAWKQYTKYCQRVLAPFSPQDTTSSFSLSPPLGTR